MPQGHAEQECSRWCRVQCRKTQMSNLKETGKQGWGCQEMMKTRWELLGLITAAESCGVSLW